MTSRDSCYQALIDINNLLNNAEEFGDDIDETYVQDIRKIIYSAVSGGSDTW